MDLAGFPDLHDNENRIYNVLQFGTYELKVTKSDVLASQEEVDRLAEEVGADCPAARFMGLSGHGEGIVWTCADIDSSKLWFKGKCAEHMVSGKAPSVKPGPDSDQIFAEEFAEAYATQARMLQGLDYVSEMGLQLSFETFIPWVVGDVLKEEGAGLTPEQTQECKKCVAQKAAAFLRSHIRT